MTAGSVAAANTSPLRVGYVMQADAPNLAVDSGPQGHVLAVVGGLRARGDRVRVVAHQTPATVPSLDGRPGAGAHRLTAADAPEHGGDGVPMWSDDLHHWYRLSYGVTIGRPFRTVERPTRAVQRRLGLPFLRLFDSLRFADGCATALAGFDALYERHGMLSYGGLLAARRLGVPIIYEVNGDLIEEYRQLDIRLSTFQWLVVRQVTGAMVRRADRIVAVGETIRRRLIERWHMEPARVSVVPNGVHPERFSGQVDDAAVRRRYAIGPGPVALFLGSFQPWHGVPAIVEAFARVAARCPQAVLVLVGDGRARGAVEQRVRELSLGGQVVLTGAVPAAAVPELLSVADVGLLFQPGRAAEIVETPLKLFEYMAAGLAIVAPDVPNMRRVLAADRTALLVPADDPAALAAAMGRLLADPDLRQRLGDAARRQVVAEHSWARAVERIEAVMRGAIHERCPGRHPAPEVR
jgi:glycosyltransferase involved in cell wall biosynthesis